VANKEPVNQKTLSFDEMKKFFVNHPNAKFTTAQVDQLMAAFPKKEHRGGNEAKIGVVTSWVQMY